MKHRSNVSSPAASGGTGAIEGLKAESAGRWSKAAQPNGDGITVDALLDGSDIAERRI